MRIGSQDTVVWTTQNVPKNISEEHFDWRYESSGLTDGQNWREVARLSCDRASTDEVTHPHESSPSGDESDDEAPV